MNFNFYIFGNPRGQYNQYPQDYTKDIFTPLCNDLQGSRAIIYRHMDLMHYIFIENIGHNQYFGLCLIFNKVRCQYPKNLFEFLRNIIENLALKNKKFLEYSSDGNILFSKAEFCDDIKSYDSFKAVINATLDGRNSFGFEELKTKYNGINKTGYVEFDEQNKTILTLSESYNTLIIEDSLGIQKNHTHQLITSLQEKILEKDNLIVQLNQNISSLEKQKKQYRKVILLFILVLCCCGGLYFLYDSLNQTENNLRETTEKLSIANDTITKNNLTISNLNNQISNLRFSLERETKLKDEAQAIVNKFKSASSFIITNVSFSFNDNEYKCNYFTTDSGSKTFKFKVIEEATGNVVITKDVSPYLDEGSGSFSVYFSKRLNSSNWYTIEIWSGNRLVGGSRH